MTPDLLEYMPMAILTQILILLVVASAIYASYLHNPVPFLKVRDLLPGFGAHEGETPGHGHEAHPHENPHAAHPKESLSASVKVVVYVPDAHADAVRQAIGEAGGGTIGNYTFCTFSSLGTGRYLPGPGANPMIGTVGVHERVEEERIEFTCDRKNLGKVMKTIKTVHPYEEIVIDVYPLEAWPGPEGEVSRQEAIHSH